MTVLKRPGLMVRCATWIAVPLAALVMSGCAINQTRNQSAAIPAAQPPARNTRAPTLPIASFPTGPAAIPAPLAIAPESAAVLLPAPETTADVLGVFYTPQMAALVDRLNAAIAQSPEWWLDSAAAAAPGEPLAYHPNLGLTEAEYDEFLATAEDPDVGTVEQAVIGSSTNPAGQLEVSWTSPVGGPGQLTFDPTTLAILTVSGEQILPTAWSTESSEGFVGPTSGWQWYWVDPSLEADVFTASGSSVDVQIGVRQNDGRVYLRVSVLVLDAGSLISRVDTRMLYNRPATS